MAIRSPVCGAQGSRELLFMKNKRRLEYSVIMIIPKPMLLVAARDIKKPIAFLRREVGRALFGANASRRGASALPWAWEAGAPHRRL